MRIAIIGTGRVGMVLGRRFAGAGNAIAFGSRRANDPDLSASATELGARILSPSDAVAWSEIVLLAVPWTAAREAVQGLGDLGGRILIDATNPVALGDPSVPMPAQFGFASGAEAIAAWSTGARVVKAFNTTGSANLGNPAIAGSAVPAFICGDDEAAATVAQLAAGIGFEPILVGDLGQAHLTEAAALLWITLAYMRGQGPDFAFVVARR